MTIATPAKVKEQKKFEINHCKIVLQNCSNDLINSEVALREYLEKLVKFIEASSYGACHIVYFGTDIQEKGFSLFQFIDKGHIAAHFYQTQNCGFIDIVFSKPLNQAKITEFSRLFFEAKKGQY